MKTHQILTCVALLFSAASIRADQSSAAPSNREAALVAQTAEGSTDTTVLIELGRLRMQQERFKEAVRLFERLVEIDPSRSTSHSELGSAYARRINEVNFMHQGLIARKMLDAFQKSVDLDANNLEGWIGLCQYHIHAPAIAGGDLVRAERYAREIEKRDAYQGACNLGLVAMKKDDAAAAAQHLRRAVELKPDSPYSWSTLGEALEKSGEKAEAAAAYEAALKLQSDYAVAVSGLGRVKGK